MPGNAAHFRNGRDVSIDTAAAREGRNRGVERLLRAGADRTTAGSGP